MRKLMLLMFCMVLLLGSVSAFEFDNVKSYDEKTKTFTIKNAFGLGDDIITGTLNTPQVYAVGIGYQKIAQFTLIPKQDYEDLIGDFGLFDMEKDGEKFEREIVVKYLSTEKIEVDKYKEVCGVSLNGTNHCSSVKNGKKFIDVEEWKEFNNSVKTNKEIIIGLFTTTYQGEHIEWVPKIAGVKVKEWAEWTADLNTGLVSYWNFEATSGAVLDVKGVNNGTANNIVRGDTGIIGNGFHFDGVAFTNVTVPNNANLEPATTLTMNLWAKLNRTTINTVSFLFRTGETGGNSIDYGIRVVGTDSAPTTAQGIIVIGAWSGAPDIAITDTLGDFVFDEWNMWTLKFDGTTITLYINGTEQATKINPGSITYSGQDFTIGSSIEDTAVVVNGTMDELSFWNRTLNVSSIVQLYNSGAGITFPIDNPPTVTTTNPVNLSTSTVQTTEFAGVCSDDSSCVNVSLFLARTGTIPSLNQTNSSPVSGSQTNFTATLADDTYDWFYDAWDDSSPPKRTLGDGMRFTIDSIFPIITLTSPVGDQGTFTSGRNLSLDWSIVEANPDLCWYEYQSINTTIACSLNTTNLTVTDSSAIDLIFWVNDTTGRQASDSTSWSYSFAENSVVFNGNVSETSSQFLEINLSTSLDVLSITANLNYDGINHVSNAACNGFCIVNNTIDIPLVSTGEFELKEFFWDINIFNGTDSINVNTSTQQQNVTRVHIESCDAAFVVETLNFTVHDEQNLTRISPFRFDGTFSIWLGGGTERRTNSFSNSSITEKTLCISPNSTFFTDAQIEYNEPTNITYTTRNYFFQNDTISNVSQQIPLYLLKSSISTTFILKVQDDNLLPLENHTIFIQRFYPGENLFRTVQVAQTSTNGKTIGFFETETVDYRFIIKKDGVTLLTTAKQKIVGEVAPFTLTFTIGEDLGKPWATLEAIPSLQESLTFDKITNVVTYTYLDTSGEFVQGRLVVEKTNLSFSTNIAVCEETSSQSSATIFCNVSSVLGGNLTGTYTSQGFITRGTVETLVSQINFLIEDFLEIVGNLGLLLAWFLILISSFAFKFNEIAGIFMVNATIIFVNIIGLVSFGTLAVSAIVAVSIIIVAVMER